MEGKINIEGEDYSVKSIEDIDYKSRIYFVVIMSAVSAPIYVYFFYILWYKPFTMPQRNLHDLIPDLGGLIFVLSIFLLVWFSVYRCYRDASKCRSQWLINEKFVFVEETDEFTVENRLQELKRQIENNLAIHGVKRKGMAFRIVVVASYFGLFYLISQGYIKEGFSMPLFLVATAALFIYMFMDELDTIKWRK